MSFNFINNNLLSEKTSLKIYNNQKVLDNISPWIDDIFPPNENSLLGKNDKDEDLDPNEGKYKMIHSSEVEWKRINEIIPSPRIYEGIIDTSNIRFGRLSYIYFYSVLTALINKFPSIIEKIIINKEYNKDGIYQIILFIDGEYQMVYVDDYKH